VRLLFLSCALSFSVIFAQESSQPTSPEPETIGIVAKPTPQNRPKAEQPPDQKQNKADDEPDSATESIDRPAANNKKQNAQHKPRRVWKKAFAPETWSNWLLAILGIVGGILALRSLNVLRDQTASNKLSADAAKQSADISGKAAKLAESTLLLTERADILIERIETSTGKSFNADTIVTVIFKNYGRTRANAVVSKGWIVFRETREELLQLTDAEPDETIPPTVPVVVGAGNILPFVIRPPVNQLNDEGIIAVNSGKLATSFGAQVTYLDVFGKSHCMKARGIFNPATHSFHIAKSESD
jgi:hypothetical protein